MAIYIQNRIFLEELRLANQMSEELGMEIFLSINKILTPEEYMKKFSRPVSERKTIDLSKNELL